MPHNFIAFEYPTGQPSWWYDIVEGLPDPIVKDGFIDLSSGRGTARSGLIPQRPAARARSR